MTNLPMLLQRTDSTFTSNNTVTRSEAEGLTVLVKWPRSCLPAPKGAGGADPKGMTLSKGPPQAARRRRTRVSGSPQASSPGPGA